MLSFHKPAFRRPRADRSRRPISAMLVCAALAWAGTAVRAEEPGPVIGKKWYFNAGTYLTDFATDASVGTGSAIGTYIRIEDDLGVDSDQSIFRFEGYYRFNERHAIEAGYWSVARTGAKVIEDEIEFQDVVYDIGAEIDTEADVDYIRLGWRYSMVRSDAGEAGITAGLSTFSFDVALEGIGTISDGMGGTVTESIRSDKSFVAPAPTIGLFINYAITPRFVLRAKADFLDVDYSDYEATLSETVLAFDWFFVKNVGIGIGTLTTRIDFKDTGPDPVQIDYRQAGIMGYVAASF